MSLWEYSLRIQLTDGSGESSSSCLQLFILCVVDNATLPLREHSAATAGSPGYGTYAIAMRVEYYECVAPNVALTCLCSPASLD